MATTETWEFDDVSAVHEVAPGLRRAELAEGWDMGGVPNGGYLLAVAARALSEETGRPDPLAVTCHYVSPARLGPIQIEASVIRAAHRHSSATALVTQEDACVAFALATLTDLSRAPASRPFTALVPPDLPEPEDCILVRPVEGLTNVPPPIATKLELRLRPEDVGFAFGQPHGRAEMMGWASFADGRPPDTLSLLLFADALPPTVFNAGYAIGWMPTLELTVHVRKRPAPGPLLCAFKTNLVSGGYLEIDGNIFDGNNEVVAMSRQLAVVPRTRS
ncbi:MAG TPA: thioesterase family protein [Actinomycetota bacterium]|nr:thioesterase family protein [Actinomycetota bacterium]